MALTAGTRLGPYEIADQLGAGGMGEVYRATDTRLDRTVAIKVLPEHLADDPQRRERFEREAKAVSSLNHPHICTLYDVGEQEGIHYLVMELVEGETLQQQLEKGRLPLEQALEYAIQIADALDKAHRQGVVHRDLKPGNIMLTKSAGVKLLDFGLAKLKGDAGAVSPLSQMPTQDPSAPLTAEGTIIGTLQYMAPEQLEGKEADARTDIFAFGAVVYEMVTGKKAFEGASQASLIHAIMGVDPPSMSDLQALTPRPLDRLVRQCLAKDPDDRWQSAGDLMRELKWIADGADGTVESEPSQALMVQPILPWALTVVMFIVLVALSIWTATRLAPPTTTALHVQLVLPPGVHLAVDTEHPTVALSADGSKLVFVGEQDGVRRLYLRELGADESRVIDGTDSAASPFFSPDGEQIGFFIGRNEALVDPETYGPLHTVSVASGVPLPIPKSNGPSISNGATWLGVDTLIQSPSPNSGLRYRSVPDRGTQTSEQWVQLTDGVGQHAWPSAVPGSGSILFTDNSPGRLEALVQWFSLDTGETKTLVRGGTNPRYSSTGHVLYGRSGSLYAVGFDAERGETTAGEFKLLDGVLMGNRGAVQFSVAANGTLAYVAGVPTPAEYELVWVDRDGVIVETIREGETRFRYPHLSLDDTDLSVTIGDQNKLDVWRHDLVRGSMDPLSTDPGEDFNGIWDPSGRRLLAFASEMNEDGPEIAWIEELRQGPEVLFQTLGPRSPNMPTSWSPDGRLLAFTGSRDGLHDIYLLDVETREERLFLMTPGITEQSAVISPDGEWIAYVSNRTGRNEVYLQPFPGGGDPTPISTAGGREPVWARNGREIFYREENRLMAVTLGDSPNDRNLPTLVFEDDFEKTDVCCAMPANYDVSSDGSRFVMVRRKNPVTPTVIDLIFNWPALLERNDQ